MFGSRYENCGLIPEKSKAEIYLGSMESNHTTRFTRKKRAVWYKMAFHFLIFNLEQIGWPLRNIHNSYQYLKWQWIFYFLLTRFFPLSLPRFLPDLTVYRYMSNTQQRKLTVNNIFISILFDFRMQIIQSGTVAMAFSAHGNQ
jgi:magnesium-transporting ATPase (P-type)